MAHLRQQIRAAVAAALTGLSTSGPRVYASRVFVMHDSEDPTKSNLPGLRIYTRREESANITAYAPALKERKLELVIECCAKSNATVDDTLDTMASEVEVAMYTNQTLGGLARYAQLQSTEIDVSFEGEKPLGVATLTYELLYLAAENAPETAA